MGLKMLIQRMVTNISLLVTSFRCLITTIFVFSFFEILPQYPLGVSEVHFIFGATLFLFFGAGATAFGLVAGLSLQGLLFAPSDLPQLYINISTLLFPLFAVSYIAKKIVPSNAAYTDLRYRDVLTLTGIYQGGIILWVAFWCFYGQGFGQVVDRNHIGHHIKRIVLEGERRIVVEILDHVRIDLTIVPELLLVHTQGYSVTSEVRNVRREMRHMGRANVQNGGLLPFS